MFSLLSPLALWLAPLIAVPLVLALMGRARPAVRDFPSLLPVRASLQRAMKRHRLKNLLQLILRTLAITCLVLAAAGPVWRGCDRNTVLAPPARAALLFPNNVYAAIPVPGEDGAEGPSTEGVRFARLQAALDSLTASGAGGVLVEPVIPESELPVAEDVGGSGRARTHDAGRHVERYGAPAEATARLFQKLVPDNPDAGAVHAFVPVFSARDLAALALAARPWLESRPGAQLIVLDHGDAAERLTPFGRARFDHVREGLVDISVETSAGAAGWRGAGEDGARDARVTEGKAAYSVPLAGHLPTAQWIAGTFVVDAQDPARPVHAVADHPVAYRIPPPTILCHVGSRDAFLSLASLGEGSEGGAPAARLRVRALDPAGGVEETCDALYLADPSVETAAWLSRAATRLRSGGVVILETGPNTDAALWNRNLLAPLGVGRLTEVVEEQAATRATPALNAVRASRWGNPGVVKKRFGFRAENGTATLLETTAGKRATDAAHDASRAVLVERRVGKGRLLVWTTSLSNPGWSDIGLGPWAVLAHQAVLADEGLSEGEERRVDTDSLAWWPASGSAVETAPRVQDPAGRPFPRVAAEAGGWTLGPFPRAGLYRITPHAQGAPDARNADSVAWLAATLAPPPPPPREADWKAFEEALGPTAWARTRRIDASGDWRSLYGGVNARAALLALAALLLFAEGVVSLRLSRASRREAPR